MESNISLMPSPLFLFAGAWIIRFRPRISEALATDVTAAQLSILAQQPHVS